MKNSLSSYTNLWFAKLALDEEADILCWKLKDSNLSEHICVYIGSEDQSFFNLMLSIKG